VPPAEKNTATRSIQTLEGSALQVAETATRISAIVNAFD
jgi:hypothetical protein